MHDQLFFETVCKAGIDVKDVDVTPKYMYVNCSMLHVRCCSRGIIVRSFKGKLPEIPRLWFFFFHQTPFYSSNIHAEKELPI
jgi:hypothetical protein